MEIREVTGADRETLIALLELPSEFGRTADEKLLGGFDELGQLRTGVGLVRQSSGRSQLAPSASLFVTQQLGLEPALLLLLIDAAVALAGRLGCVYVQVLSYASVWDQALVASGFEPTTEALTLSASTNHPAVGSDDLMSLESPGFASDSILVRVPPGNEVRLVELVEKTYEGSDDAWSAPAGESAEDHLARLQQQSDSDSLWFVIRDHDRDAGVMLFGTDQRVSAVLLYLGLVPSARGKGLARRALREAFGILQKRQIDSVLVQVAAANDAANRTYSSQGFVELRRGTLFVRSIPNEPMKHRGKAHSR